VNCTYRLSVAWVGDQAVLGSISHVGASAIYNNFYKTLLLKYYDC